jgi:Tol biopolymer transport system component/DNA-binding winged helix-turn-helix (wHTH) protein
MSPHLYEFGAYRVDVTRRTLFRGEQPVQMPPKVFDTLLELARHEGQVVTKDELLRAVWPDVAVEENSLARNISLLRKTLGESASDHRYIVTLPGRGYSFVAPVRHDGAPPEQALAPVRKPAFRSWRALGFGAALVAVALAILSSAGIRRTVELPFAAIRTTRLTSSGRAVKAAISPDGRYIAHISNASGQDSLLVTRTDTLHDIEIVPPGPFQYFGLTFSRDGESIYYVTGTHGGDPVLLHRIPVGGGPSLALKEGLDSPVTFSPDGKKYAFVREAAGESQLMVADVDSGAEQKLNSHKLPQVLDYPAWSPDGRIIACTAVDSSMASPRGSDARLIEVRIADRTERMLSGQSWPFIRQLAWTGDGNGLLMSARDQPTGAFHIWYVAYPGGTARKVTEGLNSQTGVSVSADSNRLVTVAESTFSGIWRMRSTETGDAEPISPESGNCDSPAWTADGRIVFEQELSGQRHIWSMAADGSDRKQLTAAGNNYFVSISGDGRLLAYASDRSGHPGIWTMDTGGGSPRLVVEAGRAIPQISPDGKWVAFTAVGAGGWTTLWRVAASGGRAIELNDKLWYRAAISPDGKWIAGFHAGEPLNTQTNPNSIAVVGSDGGEARKVIPISPSVSTAVIRWSRDGRELMYVESRREGANIWSRPLDGGAPRQITHLHGYALFSFDWSRDGRELAFARGIKARDVVLIEDAKSGRVNSGSLLSLKHVRGGKLGAAF